MANREAWMRGRYLHRINWHIHKPMRVFAPGTSLRRRVAYSLAIVRLILVPVIALAVYYLFAMSWIVDRIVRVDAQVATLAESVSIQMLNARRMELNYFLLHDPNDLSASWKSLDDMQNTLKRCVELQPAAKPTVEELQAQLGIYRQRLSEAVQRLSNHHESPAERFQNVVRAYESNLQALLKKSRRESRANLLEDLRSQSGSFDTQVTAALARGDPTLRRVTQDLQTSSNAILQLSSALERKSWDRVRRDHRSASGLVDRAEWILGSVSFLVIVLSVLVSFILPRQVVKPLMDLKAAVDHAAAGNYEIQFDVKGNGEVAQLAHSVKDLIDHVSEKAEKAAVERPESGFDNR
ncbi:MAG: HAMP domain-containing protein [Terriglobia bacterium]